MTKDPNSELKFTLLDSKLKGVGGWLALFIIGQTIGRSSGDTGRVFTDK